MRKYDALKFLNLSGKVSGRDIKAAYNAKLKELEHKSRKIKTLIIPLIEKAYNSVKDTDFIEVYQNESHATYFKRAADAICLANSLSLEVEACGVWFWLFGEEKGNCPVLGGAGWTFSLTKRAWYFCPEQKNTPNQRSISMEEIRKTYGSSKATARHLGHLTSFAI